MIRVEIITEDGNQYMRTYSDVGRHVVRDGIEYDEAIDPVDSGREYTEGTPIEVDDGEESEAERIVDVLLGEEP